MALPHGPPWPAVVQTMLFLAFPEGSHLRATRRFGDLYTARNSVFGTEVMVSDPELIKQIFTGDPDVFHAGEANAALGSLVGERSMLLLDGAEHLRHRRMMMPPFHGERMQSYGETMRTITEQTIASWKVGDTFSLHPTMQRITLDIILRTVFGVDTGRRYDELHDRLTSLFNLIQSPLGLLFMIPSLQVDFGPLSPWGAFQRQMDSVNALLYAQIAERRAELSQASPPKRTDVLTLLLEARDDEGRGLSDQDLRDELMTLLAAGHETTATTLCWAFEKILSHPEVLRRLHDELDTVAPGRPVRADDLPKLEYLDATLKEVLRLRPVIPVVGRRLKAPIVLRGHTLPAGTMVVPSAYATHRRADVYPDPERFLPDRFLGKKPDPYAWLPFGGGIRRCVGMAFALYELKVVLTTVLRSARLRLAKPAPLRVVLRSFVFAPQGGTRVVMEAKTAN